MVGREEGWAKAWEREKTKTSKGNRMMLFLRMFPRKRDGLLIGKSYYNPAGKSREKECRGA
jgi:hypothetical protein